MSKSTPDQIRERFDRDVERFSNLETGQTATVDAPLVMDLIARAAAAANPEACSLLDVGCGAGNYSLRLLQERPGLDVTLLDLSRPMLDRAFDRVSARTNGRVETVQADVREANFPESRFDLILAAMVLHHLRTESQWRAVFEGFHRWLKPGGSLWIADLVAHSNPAVQDLMWRRYGDYLAALKDESYRDHVFAYIEQEDTPRSLTEQLDWLRQVGFETVDVLHKHSSFAAFGASKSNQATA